jgi:hypothetical protein
LLPERHRHRHVEALLDRARQRAVADGVVYVVAGDGLYAFDATGNADCSGTPKWSDPASTDT